MSLAQSVRSSPLAELPSLFWGAVWRIRMSDTPLRSCAQQHAKRLSGLLAVLQFINLLFYLIWKIYNNLTIRHIWNFGYVSRRTRKALISWKSTCWTSNYKGTIAWIFYFLSRWPEYMGQSSVLCRWLSAFHILLLKNLNISDENPFQMVNAWLWEENLLLRKKC